MGGILAIFLELIQAKSLVFRPHKRGSTPQPSSDALHAVYLHSFPVTSLHLLCRFSPLVYLGLWGEMLCSIYNLASTSLRIASTPGSFLHHIFHIFKRLFFIGSQEAGVIQNTTFISWTLSVAIEICLKGLFRLLAHVMRAHKSSQNSAGAGQSLNHYSLA